MRDEWRNSRIRNYLDLASGKTKPNDTVIDLSEQCSIPVYGGNGILGYSSQVLINHETLVIGRVGEYCGTVRYVNTPCWVTDNAIYAKSIDEDYIYPKFIAYLLSFQKLGRFRKRGGQPLISQKNIYTLRIALPPLPEQRRIAEILSTWDAAIGLVEQRIAAAEQRKKGLVQRLLTGRVRFAEFVQSRELRKTKIGTYPKEWRIRRLSDVAEIQVSYVDKKSKPSEQPVRLCNYMDVFNNDYIYDQMDFMEASATESEIQKCTLKKQDVIITKDSETREEIAESCVVVEDLTNVVCGYHLTILRSKKNVISGFFLKDVLSSPSVHHQFVKLANGTTRFGLTISATHKALIPVPSVAEQEKIAAVLQTCDREIELLTRKRDALQRQQKGLMQRLLTGRVRV